ncbi:FIT family protein [Trichinella britovi]|uniref:FIT family protein n=1 Tax=Trichinella britovi TaxID=45882 RepID=A0A0V1D477_TRIBR|nr:FIT family protein [Trichinella britovi]KRZ95676.1 FIT family protein [Trichinella sp. T8]
MLPTLQYAYITVYYIIVFQEGRIRENDVIFNSSGINESSTPARRTLPPPESLGSIFTSMMLHLFRNYMLFPAEKRAIIYVVFVMLASIIADLRPLSRWHYFVRKDNIFNLYFVKWGWAWVFTFLGTFIVLTSYVYTIGNLRHVLTHFFRMIISTFIWWFCVTIFVHVEKRTGFCTKKSYAEKQLCIMNGGRWLSFDVSGHCFLLIYCCLLMAEELRVFKYWDHIKYALDSNNRDSVELAHLNDAEVEFCKIEYGRCTSWIRLFFVCTTMLNFLWEVMLIVTVLYFHSLAQKFAGTVIAVCCWYFTYRVWYRSEGSPGLPGVGKLPFYLTVFALQCHYCVHSYKKISDESSIDCLKLERNDTYNQRECTLKETACKATVKLVNGILTEVIRDCSANCNPRCSRKGYGITVLTCDSCCNTSKCNSWSSQEFFSSSSTVRSSLTLILSILQSNREQTMTTDDI